MHPLFWQNWSFFSPEPGIDDSNFFYRCLKKGRSGGDDILDDKWNDYHKDIIIQHQENRFKGLGKVLYLYKGMAHFMIVEYEKNFLICQEDAPKKSCEKVAMAKSLSTPYFKLAHKVFEKSCPRKNFSGYQFKIVIEKPTQYSTKGKNILRDSVSIVFPKISYGQHHY